MQCCVDIKSQGELMNSLNMSLVLSSWSVEDRENNNGVKLIIQGAQHYSNQIVRVGPFSLSVCLTYCVYNATHTGRNLWFVYGSFITKAQTKT